MAESKKAKRPKAGDTLPGEPTEQEIINGAANTPSEDVIVTLDGVDYPIVELGFMDWRTYISCLLPAVEETAKSLLPLLTSGARAWDLVRGGSKQSIVSIREAASSGDKELLTEMLTLNGIISTSDEDLNNLINCVQDDGAFAAYMTQLISRPLINILSDISISSVLIKAMDKLPDMALSTIAASMERRGLPTNRRELKLQIEKHDGFELFNVVTAQIVLYQERGKLRSFFEQMKALVMSRLSPTQRAAIETRTA